MGISDGQRSDSCNALSIYTRYSSEKARKIHHLTGRHQNRRDDQELSIVAPEHAQKPQDNKSTDQDAKSDWKTTNTTSDRVMAIHIVRLSRPEEDDGEKIGSGDEGDDERHGQDPWVLPETAWEHRIFGTPQFPGHECNEQENPEERRGEHVCRVPFILPPISLHQVSVRD